MPGQLGYEIDAARRLHMAEIGAGEGHQFDGQGVAIGDAIGTADHEGKKVETEIATNAATDIELVVEDDGRASERAVRSGMGLLGMRERVASLGGQLSFEARPGRGAVLRVTIPGAALRSPVAGVPAAGRSLPEPECAA